MLFYVALVPTLIPLAEIGKEDYAALVIVTAVVLLIVLVPYICWPPRRAKFLKEPSALKLLNRTAGGILAGNRRLYRGKGRLIIILFLRNFSDVPF